MDIVDENGLAAVWLASTLEKKLKRADVQDVNIEDAARHMLRPKDGPLPLRMEGQLMYGLAQILNHRAKYLLQDSTETDKGLLSLFSRPKEDTSNKRRKNTSATMASQPSQVLDLMPQEFDLGQVLAGLSRDSGEINSSSPPAEDTIDYDQSIDAIVRGDSDPVADEELVPMSAADQSALGDLNLLGGIEDEINEPLGDMDDEAADMTVDISNNYSSSPGPEVFTPEAEELNVEIIDANTEPATTVEERPKQRRAPAKKRLSPVDQPTTLALPKTAPAHIIRRDLPKLQDEDLVMGSWSKSVAALLDPEAISIEMKRRRLLGDDTFDDAVESDFDGHLDAQDDFSIAMDLDDEPELETEQQPVLEADSERDEVLDPEEPEKSDSLVFSQASEAAETDAAEARKLLTKALDNARGPVEFNTIARGSREKAAAFSELLIMTAAGTIKTEQESSYGPIFIKA